MRFNFNRKPRPFDGAAEQRHQGQMERAEGWADTMGVAMGVGLALVLLVGLVTASMN